MPIVNEKELLEKAAQRKKEAEATVKEEWIGDTKIFIGAKGVKYTSRGEALESIQTEKEQAEFKKLGLNEHGQTPEQVEKAKRRAELIRQREDKIREIAALDQRISDSKLPEKAEEESEKPKKNKK